MATQEIIIPLFTCQGQRKSETVIDGCLLPAALGRHHCPWVYITKAPTTVYIILYRHKWYCSEYKSSSFIYIIYNVYYFVASSQHFHIKLKQNNNNNINILFYLDYQTGLFINSCPVALGNTNFDLGNYFFCCLPNWTTKILQRRSAYSSFQTHWF